MQGGSAFCENRADSRLEPDELQPGSHTLILQPSFSVKPLIALPPPNAVASAEESLMDADSSGASVGRKRVVAGRGAAVSFFVRLPDEPGRLDAAKAAQLGPPPGPAGVVVLGLRAVRSVCSREVRAGVPQGPLLGKLKNGQPVTLPNGTVVSALASRR